MNKIRFSGNLYDSVINEGNLELQSIHETVIFPNGGTELIEDAEREFFSLRYTGERLNTFIGNYIEDVLQSWVDSNKDRAEIVTHFLN